ncbi:MAG: class I SAM-dependent methyltransferase [Marinobacter sp.]|uniref:class I SAM-dependent methyltransferase n=1 Tax=Marinobacter sp. TaxID=50741 RepID=UPI00299EFC62|nr:class I SAM-dependent methyltransferase [Marinobacter sp.]MDX1633900.1 class I SAM-dependent methyltransferase [Marinobacter sp.]
MTEQQLDRQVLASWQRNAVPWAQAVREGSIASRRTVTDQAIVSAILAKNPASLLDIGCGEGWLARALAAEGVRVTGVDAIAELVAQARALGGGDFLVCAYGELEAAALPVCDLAVCNFSLIGKESVEAVFRQVRGLLRPGGHVLVQTLHPVTACGDQPYQDGWREGSWAGFDGGFVDPPPWYFRTLAGWQALFDRFGYTCLELAEPRRAAGEPPLSVIFTLGL